jgi:dolichol-phosphate mannosyltransferase
MIRMPTKPVFSVIVPLFNESEGLPSLKKKLVPVLQKLSHSFSVELVLVDDGSRDNTLALAKKLFDLVPRTTIIPHGINRGLGAALRTGFSHATGNFLFCLDSDCTYEPSVVFLLLEKMAETNAGIVTVSPYHPNGKVVGVPKNRLWLSQGVSFLYRLALGSRLHTFTAMVRLYKRSAIEKKRFVSNDFLGVTELLVFPLLRGTKVEEVPAVLKTRKFGRSSVNPGRILRLVLRHLKLVLAIIGLRVTGV